MTGTTTARMHAKTGWTIGKTWRASGANGRANGKGSARSGRTHAKGIARSGKTHVKEIGQNGSQPGSKEGARQSEAEQALRLGKVRARHREPGREQAPRPGSRAGRGARQGPRLARRAMSHGGIAAAHPPDPWIEAVHARVVFRDIRTGGRPGRPARAGRVAGARPVAAAAEADGAENQAVSKDEGSAAGVGFNDGVPKSCSNN